MHTVLHAIVYQSYTNVAHTARVSVRRWLRHDVEKKNDSTSLSASHVRATIIFALPNYWSVYSNIYNLRHVERNSYEIYCAYGRMISRKIIKSRYRQRRVETNDIIYCSNNKQAVYLPMVVGGTNRAWRQPTYRYRLDLGRTAWPQWHSTIVYICE